MLIGVIEKVGLGGCSYLFSCTDATCRNMPLDIRTNKDVDAFVGKQVELRVWNHTASPQDKCPARYDVYDVLFIVKPTVPLNG